MDVLFEERELFYQAFWETIQLLGISAVVATVVGTFLGTMRVAPVPMLNAIGTSYVNIVRNTPLVVMFLLIVFGLPQLGIHFSYFIRANIALSVYTAAFVCEAIRSGINTVAAGQAEAARSVGMTFTQTLRTVVLPQAFRAVVPPLTSVYIALAKNTSVAAGFGVTELTAELSAQLNNHPAAGLWLFFGVGLAYVLIVAVISSGSHLLERRWAVSR
jgi:glutamate transport system permease protein